MGELPIEAAIARVAVEAHRHRFGVVRSRADRIAGAVLAQLSQLGEKKQVRSMAA
jgi:hypothetical protein